MKIIQGSWLYYKDSPQFIILKRESGLIGRKLKSVWNELYQAEQHAKEGDIVIEIKTVRTWNVHCPKLTEI